MTAKHTRYASGFTIVELLIVIIVITILALIVIATYNGTQERARLSTAQGFEQSFRAKYLADATGAWGFDECSGSSVKNNTSTNSSTDTIQGTVSWLTTGTPPGHNCALHFDGTTHIETSATLGTGISYAKGAWVRLASSTCASATTSYNIMSQSMTNGAASALYMPNCQPAAGNTGGTGGTWDTARSSKALNDGLWHYIAVTWENNILTLYVDGNSVSVASTTGPPNPGGNVAIGAFNNSYYMIGDIANPFVAAK